MPLRRISYLVAVTLLATTAHAGSSATPSPLTLKMSSYLAPAKSELIVHMRVEPDARSRELTVEWLADDLSGGSHAITLEGARAAATHQYRLKHLAVGRHTVTAILKRDDGSEVRRTAKIVVIGVGGPDIFSDMLGASDSFVAPRIAGSGVN